LDRITGWIDGNEAMLIFWAIMLGLVLYGHYRGLLKMLVSVLSLVLTFIGVRLLMPYAAAAFQNDSYLTFAVLFLLLFLIIRIVVGFLNLAARLPLIHGLNQLAGAAAGFLEGLLFCWLLYLLAAVTAQHPFCAKILAQVEESPLLSFAVRNNPLLFVLEQVFREGLSQFS